MASIKIPFRITNHSIDKSPAIKFNTEQVSSALSRKYSQIRIARTILQTPIKAAPKNQFKLRKNYIKPSIFGLKISPITKLDESFIGKQDICELNSLISFKKG